jgi:hypothetical protein
MLFAIGVTGAFGDIWIYEWSKTGKPSRLLLAGAVWLLSLLLFGFYLKWDIRPFGTAFMLSTVLHILMVAAWDVVYYRSAFTPLEWTGMAFGLLAVVFLEIGSDPANVPHATVDVRSTQGTEVLP